jgi:hypothetical protein
MILRYLREILYLDETEIDYRIGSALGSYLVDARFKSRPGRFLSLVKFSWFFSVYFGKFLDSTLIIP